MDLRRWGEFAFGIGVFMCGGAFLLLALERLNAPVLTGVQHASSIVAAVPEPAAAAASAAPAVYATASPTVAVLRRARIAFVRRPTRPSRPTAPLIVAAAPISSKARPIAAPAVFERPQAVARPTNHAAAHPRQRHEAPIAAIHRSDAQRSPIPRMLAVANPTHRAKNSMYRSPVSERTPEPPIGYDDHPALLHSDGPNAAMPTMEPVRVELTTTHLGR